MTELAVRQDTSPALTQAPAALVAWAGAASAAHQLVAPLVTTDFCPAQFRPKGNSEDALRMAQASATAAVLYGAEAGLSPMQSLQGIYVIAGRPALYARTMLAITLSAGHDVYTEESTDDRAIVCGRRRGSQHVERVVVTIDQARKAGWTNNKKYSSEPATMLLARAQSQVCRRVAPDALAGLAFSAEEIEDESAPTTTMSRGAGERRTARRASPPPPPEPELDAPAPEPAAVSEAGPDDGEGITPPQLKKLHAALNDAGHSDRDSGLTFISETLGRPVESSKDLSKEEASRVIDALESGVPVEDPPEPPGWANEPPS